MSWTKSGPRKQMTRCSSRKNTQGTKTSDLRVRGSSPLGCATPNQLNLFTDQPVKSRFQQVRDNLIECGKISPNGPVLARFRDDLGPNLDQIQKRRNYLRRYQNQWTKRRRLAWIDANGPCRRCGSSHRLEVDHIDPEQKEFEVRALWSRRKEIQDQELAKCQVLCWRCHREKTRRDLSIISSRQTPRAKKLSPEQVREIYRQATAGGSPRHIAQQFGINHSTVIGIRDGKHWSSITNVLRIGGSRVKEPQLP